MLQFNKEKEIMINWARLVWFYLFLNNRNRYIVKLKPFQIIIEWSMWFSHTFSYNNYISSICLYNKLPEYFMQFYSYWSIVKRIYPKIKETRIWRRFHWITCSNPHISFWLLPLLLLNEIWQWTMFAVMVEYTRPSWNKQRFNLTYILYIVNFLLQTYKIKWSIWQFNFNKNEYHWNQKPRREKTN